MAVEITIIGIIASGIITIWTVFRFEQIARRFERICETISRLNSTQEDTGERIGD
tara:strand:+ start:2599 stop:2763 length:165 start_codon:yes stop_codon:yes gene_type:complete